MTAAVVFEFSYAVVETLLTEDEFWKPGATEARNDDGSVRRSAPPALSDPPAVSKLPAAARKALEAAKVAGFVRPSAYMVRLSRRADAVELREW